MQVPSQARRAHGFGPLLPPPCWFAANQVQGTIPACLVESPTMQVRVGCEEQPALHWLLFRGWYRATWMGTSRATANTPTLLVGCRVLLRLGGSHAIHLLMSPLLCRSCTCPTTA